MYKYTPPFTLTDYVATLVAEIGEQVGRVDTPQRATMEPHLRKKNRIRTIHSSLAIEHNSLSLEQVTAIMDGKRVLGSPREIQEVRGAIAAYERLPYLDPLSVKDLLNAHQLMMDGLVNQPGHFRTGGVGIFRGPSLIHMGPPAHMVPGQIDDLIAWYKNSTTHPLIKSAVFHYEFEFIHPFDDGNGRMGRLWHSLLLGTWRELFFWLPIEELIQARQSDYYDTLGVSDSQGDSTSFVELMLEIIRDSLAELTPQDTPQDTPQVRALLEVLGDRPMTTAELMSALHLSDRKNFRALYLLPALDSGVIEMTIPEKPTSRNQRYRRTPGRSGGYGG